MRGPSCIFWANLTPFSLQRQAARFANRSCDASKWGLEDEDPTCKFGIQPELSAFTYTEQLTGKGGEMKSDQVYKENVWGGTADFGINGFFVDIPADGALKVRQTPGWPRSWANSSL